MNEPFFPGPGLLLHPGKLSLSGGASPLRRPPGICPGAALYRLVDGKSVETVGIAIGSDVPHTILSVDPALVVFIDELTPMSRCVKHTTVAGCFLADAGCVCFFQGEGAVGKGTHGDRCDRRRC